MDNMKRPAIKVCECCQHPLVAENDLQLSLSGMQNVIFNLVERSGRGGINISLLLDRIYAGAKDPPLWAHKSTHVQIYLMNKKLKKHSLTIRASRNGSRYSVYTLDVL